VFLDSKGRWWIAPRNFYCDGGSKPRPTWVVAGHPLEGAKIRGYVLHDRYYQKPDGRSRSEVDRMMYEAHRADGVGFLSAQVEWTTVRWLGRFAWSEHRRREGGDGIGSQ
jgi:hypothetical protein